MKIENGVQLIFVSATMGGHLWIMDIEGVGIIGNGLDDEIYNKFEEMRNYGWTQYTISDRLKYCVLVIE